VTRGLAKIPPAPLYEGGRFKEFSFRDQFPWNTGGGGMGEGCAISGTERQMNVVGPMPESWRNGES